MTVEKKWSDLLHALKQQIEEVDPKEISILDTQAAQHVADVLKKKLENMRGNP